MHNYKKSDCHCDVIETGQELLSVEAAREIALELVAPVTGSKLLPLQEAMGRVTARPLHAPIAMPFFNNSAMDGYAISITSLFEKGPWTLPVGSTVSAGANIERQNQFSPGKMAIRIFTGAPVPEGYDAVIPQENCTFNNGSVTFDVLPKLGSNIRYKGSDMDRGAVLVEEGTRIAARHLGLLAANGYRAINVRKVPRIAIFSTGDELVEPGKSLKPGQIYDCNKPLLIALCSELGLTVVDLGAFPDDLRETRILLEKCSNEYDLILSTGSVSVGERDFLKQAFTASGGTISNWKVAVKPGKPILFGKLGETVFTGLPGNPYAAYVGFHLFVKPQILKLCGSSSINVDQTTAVADFFWQRKPGRAEVFPVKRKGHHSNGLETLDRLGNSVSATLFPLTMADGLAQVPSDCQIIKPGDTIQWQSFCR